MEAVSTSETFINFYQTTQRATFQKRVIFMPQVHRLQSKVIKKCEQFEAKQQVLILQ
jgi:hypothetical protein